MCPKNSNQPNSRTKKKKQLSTTSEPGSCKPTPKKYRETKPHPLPQIGGFRPSAGSAQFGTLSQEVGDLEPRVEHELK